MKTSELKISLRANYLEMFFEETYIITSRFFTIWKKEQKLILHGEIPLNIVEILVEYNNTPISEREDEKKYNLKYNDTFFDFMDSWLVQESDGKFRFSVFMKGKFTQSEIDDFPKEIKGAIECGFLKKVEVK